MLHFSKQTYTTENDEWMNYRSDVFGPRLSALLKKLHPAQMKQQKEDAECDYFNEEWWKFPVAYFTNEGLMICPDFPHVAGACRDPEWSVIPYRELTKYIDPRLKLTLP